MNNVKLAKKIDALAAKLKPVVSEGIRIDFNSFTDPEKLILLKNVELTEKYQGNWTREAILENQDLILKCNDILIRRVIELFLGMMPAALMLNEIERDFFKLNFDGFLERWIECQKNLRRWSQKDKQDYLDEKKKRGEVNGKENYA